ncbi:MAG: aminoglycoside phosphotransferase family protein [Alphaproteobacteria bacterium]|nr:aminoglycoside phosphotransferase family protein [Alphaproteobacteria bacterium]
MGDTASEIVATLVRLGVARPGETAEAEALTGGVSSDIWRVALSGRTVCVKRALAKLKVAQDWRAPVERNAYEVDWMRVAASAVPEAVPPLVAVDDAAKLFVMAYLDPGRYPLWKAQLRDGVIEPATAQAVGERLARIHAATAGRADIAARFPTDSIFHAIRLEPYLEATARRHGDLAERLHALVVRTAATRRALVHGDVSPKNILVGPHGPVFLDAECAWFGDPAFDLAFCLNHLLLKCVWRPAAASRYLDLFDRLAASYLAGVDWEPRDEIEARVAALLPGLFLARVDGKSPVEYITTDADRDKVRRVAHPLIAAPPARLAAIRSAWATEITSWSRGS